MIALRYLLLAALVSFGTSAIAADVVYPTGSRIGLVPPPGLTASPTFAGFEDRDNRVAILLVALPGDAFAEIAGSTHPEPLRKQGVTVESREEMSHALGKAILITGHQKVESTVLRKWILVVSAGDITALVTVQVPAAAQAAYSDAAIRTALASVSVRPAVPIDEQLSLLPFRVTELAGFKIGGVIAGRAVMLTDGAGAPGIDTHIVIAIAPGGPAQASQRDRFARDVFATIPNLRDLRIETSEPLRIGGQQGHQILAHGKDGATGTDVTVVQWIRFGGGAYLHLIGVARTDAWIPAYSRFRKVRDGIEAR